MPGLGREGLVDTAQPAPASAPETAVGGPVGDIGGDIAGELKRSLIEPTGRRLAAVFLRRDECPAVDHACGDLMSRLLLECFERFVASEGGSVVWSARLSQDDEGEALPPIRESLTIDGAERTFVRNGWMFVESPAGRVVVHVWPDHQCNTHLTVQSDTDAAGFLKRWQEFAKSRNYLRGRAFLADGKLVERKRDYGWDDVLIPEASKQMIRLHVEGFLARRDELRALGVKVRRGLLLAGPPGTGKTSVAKVLEGTLEVSTLWVTPRHVPTPDAFAGILTVARFVAPTVVVLEDLDLFAEERDNGGGLGLGELMNQLDGAVDNEDIVTIATTNRLDAVEKALRNRPGRFDRVVEFGPMDADCRRKLLAKLLSRAEVSAADLGFLTEATDGHTGAQMEELANTVYLHAVAAGRGPADGKLAVDRAMLAAALGEVRVVRRKPVGFRT